MGHHYIPKKYLLGFCKPVVDKHLWVYDRKYKLFKRKHINNVGTETDFYSSNDERTLNEEVEQPANPLLDQLRAGRSLTDAERPIFAKYISTLMTRVPYIRALIPAIPGSLDEDFDNMKNDLIYNMQRSNCTPEVIKQRIEILESNRLNIIDLMSPSVEEINRSPCITTRHNDVVLEMKWRFLTTKGPSFFLTSDNPVVIFGSMGLGRNGSEFSFPISSQLLLHGTWVDIRHGENHAIPQKWVKEFNRRTASKSSRYLYYHIREVWVASLGDNPAEDSRLSRIQW